MVQKTPVKNALTEQGLSLVFIARLTGIEYTKLSRIVNDERRATDEEKLAIALVLRRPVEELWPEVAA